MKYFAILRDSLREALDAKILYVMIALVVLFLLLLASVSYRQLTLQEEVEGVAETLNFAFGQRGGGLKFEVRDFKQLNDAKEPWNGEYEFTHVMRYPEGMSPTSQAFADVVLQHEQIVKAAYWHLNYEKIETITAPKDHPDERWLRIHSKGTKIRRKEDWTHRPELFFGALSPPAFLNASLTGSIYSIETNLVTWVGAAMIFLVGIIATSSFIPNMLAKGRLDLLLSKPISRSWLLIFKYLGGLTFVFVLTVVVTAGVWLILGIRSGIWAPGILLTALPLTFFFAILYSVSTLIGVLTRSGVVCILVTCVAWFLLWLIGVGYDQAYPTIPSPESIEAQTDQSPGRPKHVAAKPESDAGPRPRKRRSENMGWPTWFRVTVKGLYTVLPRSDDLDQLTNDLVSRSLLSTAEQKARNTYQAPVKTWWETIAVSLAFICVMLGLACWRFSKKDY